MVGPNRDVHGRAGRHWLPAARWTFRDEHRVVLVVEAESTDEVQAVLAGDPWSGSYLTVTSVDAWTIRLDGRNR